MLFPASETADDFDAILDGSETRIATSWATCARFGNPMGQLRVVRIVPPKDACCEKPARVCVAGELLSELQFVAGLRQRPPQRRCKFPMAVTLPIMPRESTSS